MEAFLGRKSGSLVDLLRQYGSGVKQRLGLLADDPAEFARGALLDIVPNYQEAQAAQNRLMGGEVDPQAYRNYIGKMQDLGGMLASIRVYHGSPHKFDKFDLSKVGTGEGNQVYGHGGYFAESPKVAEQYANDLSMRAPTQTAKQVRAEIKRVKAEEPAGWLRYQKLQQLDADLKFLKSGATSQGQVYETSLRWPDAAREAADPMRPQHFLDWDKPLTADAPQSLKDAFNRLHQTHPDMRDGFFRAYQEGKPGFHYYSMLQDNAKTGDLAKNQAFATNAMRDAGIPGVRYLDALSRGNGGTSNYVVFDDALIEILTRNGVPVKK